MDLRKMSEDRKSPLISSKRAEVNMDATNQCNYTRLEKKSRAFASGQDRATSWLLDLSGLTKD